MSRSTLTGAALLLLLSIPVARSQTGDIQWTSLNTGFAAFRGLTIQVNGVVGQSLVGFSSGTDFNIASGFLADSLLGSIITRVSGQETPPHAYALLQNFPNPFNPTSTIRYAIARRSTVQLAVYNVLGQVIALLVDGEKEPGEYAVIWNARSGRIAVSTGVYFYRLSVKGLDGGMEYSQTKKLILLR